VAINSVTSLRPVCSVMSPREKQCGAAVVSVWCAWTMDVGWRLWATIYSVLSSQIKSLWRNDGQCAWPMTLRLTGSAIGRVNWVPFLRCERGLNYTVSLRCHYSGALEPKTPEREWLDSEQWIAVFNGPEIGHLTELFIHYNASSLSDSLSAVNSAALCALVGK